MFAAHLKEKLNHGFVILHQTNSECYCVFSVRVDLALIKKHTFAVPAMEVEEDNLPIPKTLTDESQGFKHYQTLAGMINSNIL